MADDLDLRIRMARARAAGGMGGASAAVPIADKPPQQSALAGTMGEGFENSDPRAMLDAATEGVGRSLTFGFQDEISAALGATQDWLTDKLHGREPDWDKSYDKFLGLNRRRSRDIDIAAGTAETVGEVAGALYAPFTAAGGVARMAALAPKMRTLAPTVPDRIKAALGRTAANVGAGAGAAAVSSFGEGEGGFDKRLTNAEWGGAFGGGAGVLFPLAGGATSKVYQSLKKYWGVDAPNVVRDIILKNAERDGITLAQAEARLNAWAAAGAKPEALFDAFGPNVRGALRGAAAFPGEAKAKLADTLEQRQAGQADRVADDLKNTLSPIAVKSHYSTVAKMLEQIRKADADPKYAKAFGIGNVQPTDALRVLMTDPNFKVAMKEGIKTILTDMRASGNLADLATFGLRGFDKKGNPVWLSGEPHMRALDAVKVGIDQMLEKYRNPVTGRLNTDPRGRALVKFNKALVDELDAINPDYAAARRAWAGPTSAKEAMQVGRDLLSHDADVSWDQIAGMSATEKEFMRLGAAQAIRDIAAGTPDGADLVKRFFGTPGKREKLRMAFRDSADFDKFEAAMARETQMFKNARAVNPAAGSQTTPMRAEMDALDPDIASGVVEKKAFGANTVYAFFSALKKKMEEAAGHNRGPVANEIVRQLTESDPGLRRIILDELIKREAENQKRRVSRIKLPAIATTGNLIGDATQ